ncbi:hypothetical protein GUJ93_ZPchr0008g12584 [Zizania palustris]|uniref:Uncharacterized protein n=1 Tax=Zizania palustris TaxID=103762 RepID=A0A8J5REP5_ZIZPA|nr:hypothetical protein GUJ93_ZPchr0008g12584 [Zizania palustris]
MLRARVAERFTSFGFLAGEYACAAAIDDGDSHTLSRCGWKTCSLLTNGRAGLANNACLLSSATAIGRTRVSVNVSSEIRMQQQ